MLTASSSLLRELSHPIRMIPKFSLSLLLVLSHFCDGFRTPDAPTKLDLGNVKIREPAKVGTTPIIEHVETAEQVSLVPKKPAASRTKWGIDKTGEGEYWFDSRIHSLGNVGILGGLHAAVAPMSTLLIDNVAYNGRNMRFQVAEELSNMVRASNARVVDLCCGVGMSTRALRGAFPDAQSVIGVDTSPHMVGMAKFLSNHLSFVQPVANLFRKKLLTWDTTFERCNAESTSLPSGSFDLVTVMYAMHEAPKQGRERIIAEARRLLSPGGTLAILDITADYTPSPAMLAGEPYGK